MRKSLRNLSIVSGLLVIAACKGRHNNSDCELQEIKTLFTVRGMQSGTDTGYAHYILIREFSRECMDSATIVNIGLKYIDTVSTDNPVDMLNIYNSDKDFILGEVSQNWEDVDKSCLVQIWINKQSRKPEHFVFFNDKGERINEGDRWISQSR